MRPTTDLFDLTGKVVIVTGSTKGIGRAMVEGLARAGASVVVSSRKQELCDEVAAEIAAATGRRRARRSPVTSVTGTPSPSFVDGVHERFGRIDVLVNNAGINPARIGPADMTLDYWRKVFSVNLEGPLRTSQCVLPIMRDAGRRQHRATSGRWPRTRAAPNICAYGASKAALLNLTKSMARSGPVERARQHALARAVHERDDGRRRDAPQPGFLDLVAGGTFMKRVADPDEIVGPVCYLVSDASSFVTGDDLSVSGGMLK